MGPLPRSDRHDEPRAFNWFVPVETAMIEDVFVVGENPIVDVPDASLMA
jgi:hypothetical protein